MLEKFITYLKVEKNYSAHTLVAYKKDLEDFTNFFPSVDWDQIYIDDIREYIYELSERSIQTKTIKRKLSALKSFYQFCNEIEYMDRNPLDGIELPKSGKEIITPLSVQEIERLLSDQLYADDPNGIRNKLIIILLYSTGIRRDELIHLKLNNIDLSQRQIKVLGKRNKERIIPLIEFTANHLEQYLEVNYVGQEGYLFTDDLGKKLNPRFVYSIVNDYLSKVTTKKKTGPHMLRHSFASHMLNNGSDLNAIKELLGHSSLAATQVYTHSSIEELKKEYKRAHPREQKN